MNETDNLPMCNCGGAEILPGEDHCHVCLGVQPPLKYRVADFSKVGSEEWKKELEEVGLWNIIRGIDD